MLSFASPEFWIALSQIVLEDDRDGVGNRFSVLFALSPALHPGPMSAG